MAREFRDVVKIRFDPAGEEEPGAIKLFNLIKITTHQYKARAGGQWLTDPERYLDDREVLAEGLTRRQVCDLIADGVDWLTYVEGGDDHDPA